MMKPNLCATGRSFLFAVPDIAGGGGVFCGFSFLVLLIVLRHFRAFRENPGRHHRLA